jgi:hypothetical protein
VRSKRVWLLRPENRLTHVYRSCRCFGNFLSSSSILVAIAHFQFCSNSTCIAVCGSVIWDGDPCRPPYYSDVMCGWWTLLCIDRWRWLREHQYVHRISVCTLWSILAVCMCTAVKARGNNRWCNLLQKIRCMHHTGTLKIFIVYMYKPYILPFKFNKGWANYTLCLSHTIELL